MYFGDDWDTINTATMGPPLCGHHHEEKPKPSRRELPPAPWWNPPPRDQQERLRELHRQRIRAHPDSGGTHEEFLRVNAEYESLRRKLAA